MAKWAPTGVVSDHLKTLRNNNSGRFSPGDFLVFFGLPIGLAAWSVSQDFRLDSAADLIAGTAILTGALFALLIHVFTLGLRVSDDPRFPASSRLSRIIDELYANVSYSCLISLVATIILVASSATEKRVTPLPEIGRWWAAAAVLFLVHLGITTFMVLKRTQLAYKELRRWRAREINSTAPAEPRTLTEIADESAAAPDVAQRH